MSSAHVTDTRLHQTSIVPLNRERMNFTFRFGKLVVVAALLRTEKGNFRVYEKRKRHGGTLQRKLIESFIFICGSSRRTRPSEGSNFERAARQLMASWGLLSFEALREIVQFHTLAFPWLSCIHLFGDQEAIVQIRLTGNEAPELSEGMLNDFPFRPPTTSNVSGSRST